MSEQNKEYFNRILSDNTSEVDVTSSLYQLSYFLYRYYDKKVIILLDEYDTPMQEAYVGGYWDELVAFTRSLFNSAFKTQLSCPDIMLLPTLADIFRVTIDELFGETSGKAPVYSLVSDLPWPDDSKVRLALYYGRKLMDMGDNMCVEGTNLVNFAFHGGSFNVNGVCKFVCSKTNK